MYNNISNFNPMLANSTNSYNSAANGGYGQLDKLYGEINRLKNSSNYRTPLTDINEELKSCSTDELIYLQNSEHYTAAYATYYNGFIEFLMTTYGTQFLSNGGNEAAEHLLGTIRNVRNEYKNKNSSEITELRRKIAELEANAKQGGSTNE